MLQRIRKEGAGFLVMLLAFVLVGAAACQGCSAKIGNAIERHAPVLVDQAEIATRYIDECAAGNQVSCGKAKQSVAMIDAAGKALIKANKNE